MNLGRDPLTGKRAQLTRRGFATAAAAGRARRELLESAQHGSAVASSPTLTVGALVDTYLEGMDADGRLAAKTRYDYRHFADYYVRPLLGQLKVSELTSEAVLAWQRRLAQDGGVRSGAALSPNTIRLARACLAGAIKVGQDSGVISTNPLAKVPRPVPARSVPHHWSPEQARQFLALMEGDRTYPIWAFLMTTGVRIGELVWLRWENLDLDAKRARIVEFASTLGYDLVASGGKSKGSVRSIDLDSGLCGVLRSWRATQAQESPGQPKRSQGGDYVFTKASGGPYHPQYLSRLLGEYAVEAGLPRLTAHGLRHTCATLMLDAGVAPKVAAERLGHANPSLFTNLYSHVTPTMQAEAARRIGASLFERAGPDKMDHTG